MELTSLLPVITKLLENKEVLNLISNFMKPNEQFVPPVNDYKNNTYSNNNKKVEAYSLYPEPFYPVNDSKPQNSNQTDNTTSNGISSYGPALSGLLSSLSSVDLPSLMTKIGPVLEMFKGKDTVKTQEKSTKIYGADDLDLNELIRVD